MTAVARPVALLAALVLGIGGVGALGGCGDNSKPGAGGVDAATADAAPADAATVCPARVAGDVGGACTEGQNAQCDAPGGAGGDGFCLAGAVVGWPPGGYCIRFGCTVDSDCGDGNVCADAMGDKACLPGCCAGGACPAGEVCTDQLLFTNLGASACLPGDPTAPDGEPCEGFFDCGEGSICNRDTLEFPDGQCQRVACTPGDDTTCAGVGDGHCVTGLVSASGTYNGCADACTLTSDCRQNEGYVCFDSGAGGRFCRHPQAGDACAADADCGDPVVWDCETGTAFLGGYCTVRSCTENGAGCSPGSSHCWDAANDGADGDNFCVDRCADVQATPVQSTCRAGYTCQDVNRGASTVGGCLPAT